MMKIQLTKGKETIVDDENYEKLSKFKWVLSDNGYAIRWGTKSERKTVFMHCQIIERPKGFEVDHINGDRLDNRRENLRIVTLEQNRFNRKKQLGTSSIFKGVQWHKCHKKWIACIRFRKKLIHLGYYDSEQEAALAYNNAATRYFGEYAKLNKFKSNEEDF